MPKLIVPVGIPGCGKSTFGELHFNDGLRATLVSTDDIRRRLGDVNDQSRNDLVFDTFHQEITSSLLDDFDVYADATNLTKAARMKLYECGKYAAMHKPIDVPPVTIHLIVFANPDQGALRNMKRDRVVPDDVMFRMLENYEQFQTDLREESFLYDSVTEIRRFSHVSPAPTT